MPWLCLSSSFPNANDNNAFSFEEYLQIKQIAITDSSLGFVRCCVVPELLQANLMHTLQSLTNNF